MYDRKYWWLLENGHENIYGCGKIVMRIYLNDGACRLWFELYCFFFFLESFGGVMWIEKC